MFTVGSPRRRPREQLGYEKGDPFQPAYQPPQLVEDGTYRGRAGRAGRPAGPRWDNQAADHPRTFGRLALRRCPPGCPAPDDPPSRIHRRSRRRHRLRSHRRDRYGPMRTRLHDAHRGRTAVFYFDITFPETVRRHASRPQASEVTPHLAGSGLQKQRCCRGSFPSCCRTHRRR